MKKFIGNRAFDEIKAKVLSLKGTWDEVRFNRGSDYVYFDVNGSSVAYNTFNGQFMGERSGQRFTESSVELEGQSWYDELLDLLYTS